MRYGVIDCGTNSLHLLIVDIDRNGRAEVVYDVKQSPRLGEGLRATGLLGKGPIERALQTLTEYAAICRHYRVDKVQAIATSAVRSARNRREFCSRVRRATGLVLRVVDGPEEARLVAEAVLAEPGFTDGPFFIFNIGGGSTELVTGDHKAILSAQSIEVGAVNMTERFLRSDPPRKQELEGLDREVTRTLKRALRRRDVGGRGLAFYGTGGTLNNLANMHQIQKLGAPLNQTFYPFSREAVEDLLLEMQDRNESERQELPGLNPSRADIIIGGTALIMALLRYYRCEEVTVCNKGLKHGAVARECRLAQARLFRSLVARFRRTLSSADPPDVRHAVHVRDLAYALFDGLRSVHRLAPGDRTLLGWASLLHDIGYAIDAQAHHKHAYRIIREAEGLPLNGMDREIVALVARYHRAAAPSKRQKRFAKLKRRDRSRVRRLAALLQVADGFDRSHSQAVHRFKFEVTPHAIYCTPIATRVSGVDRLGAERKSALFEAVTRRRLVIQEADVVGR
ncbi:MAG: Ppx/GppA family phosphatase [Planctomycetes bacterium]|nr:Ppx/GppA family phosphatase [Planctomycetota bacterium]